MESQYEVLSPWAEVDPIPLKGILPRVTDLTGKTIGLFCHAYKQAGLPIMSMVEKKLKERFPTSKITWYASELGLYSVFDTEDKLKFEEWIKANGVDTVIVGRGD